MVLALVLTALAPLATACTATADDDAVASSEAAIGVEAQAAGIEEGSREAEGVLALANDRATNASVLEGAVGLPASVARAIDAAKVDAEGKPRWFSDLDEVDALPGTDTNVFRKLLAHARANEFVEQPGYEPPLRARVLLPDNLNRPPTSADVVVEAGFDGKTPDEVVRIVRSRITNAVYGPNEAFVERSIRDAHKRWTIAIGNYFAPGSPPVRYAEALEADRLTVLGTLADSQPTILMAEKDGVVTYHQRDGRGGWTQAPKLEYGVVMRARIRMDADAPGVRIYYPPWRHRGLAGPTSVVIEP